MGFNALIGTFEAISKTVSRSRIYLGAMTSAFLGSLQATDGFPTCGGWDVSLLDTAVDGRKNGRPEGQRQFVFILLSARDNKSSSSHFQSVGHYFSKSGRRHLGNAILSEFLSLFLFLAFLFLMCIELGSFAQL